MTNENLLIEGGQQQSLAGGIDCTRLVMTTDKSLVNSKRECYAL